MPSTAQNSSRATCPPATIRRVTWIGLAANLLLSFLKFAAGFIGNSQALVADAVHSLSDCTTDLAILVGVGFWSKPADCDHPHGHYRIEMLVTAFIGLVLFAAAIGLIFSALTSLHEAHGSRPGWIALAAAVASIIVKEILYHWTKRIADRCASGALAANAWHHRSDALSSIPVALAVVGTAINPAWVYLDQIAAVVVSLLIFKVAWKIMAPALGKLLDRGAPQEDLDRINAIAMATNGVKDLHGLRTRYIGCSGLQVDLHIQVDATLTVLEGHDISEQVKHRLIADGPDVMDVIVHLEPATTASSEPGS